AAARVDVLDEDGAGGRAVALPELVAVHAVTGVEEGLRVDGDQAAGVRIRGAGVDVLDEVRARGGAVGEDHAGFEWFQAQRGTAGAPGGTLSGPSARARRPRS